MFEVNHLVCKFADLWNKTNGNGRVNRSGTMRMAKCIYNCKIWGDGSFFLIYIHHIFVSNESHDSYF